MQMGCDAETQTLMDWTPGAAILDAEITMHGSDQYDFGYVQQDRSAWRVALVVIASDLGGGCRWCWGNFELVVVVVVITTPPWEVGGCRWN